MDSILTSTKKLLGIESDYAHFDADIIMHINSVLTILTQMGIGPMGGFSISGDTETWQDFVSGDLRFESVKSYVYMKVRLLFDPPISNAAIESTNKLVGELEWRLSIAPDFQNPIT